MFKSRRRGKSYQVEHLGEKTIDADGNFYGVTPEWRDGNLLIERGQNLYRVLGLINEANEETISYTTIPLKFQKNCRAFLKSSAVGLEGKIIFDEKKVIPKTKQIPLYNY